MYKSIVLFFLLFNQTALSLNNKREKPYFFGWYGYDPNNMVGWTNIAHSNNKTLLINNANRGIHQLYELSYLYVSSFNRLLLHPDWKQMTDKNHTTVLELFKNKTIIGFFMGDELMWNGLPYSNLTHASNYFRKLYPFSFIWENEAVDVLKCNKTYGTCHDVHNNIIHIKNGIPPALSAISIDMYHMSTNNGFVSQVRQFYKQWIYPKLHSHQKVFVVPGSYASNFNSLCNFTCYDIMCAVDAINFYTWSLFDKNVIGIVPWNWFGCDTCEKYKDEIGTINMNITKKVWKIIGNIIVN